MSFSVNRQAKLSQQFKTSPEHLGEQSSSQFFNRTENRLMNFLCVDKKRFVFAQCRTARFIELMIALVTYRTVG